MKVAHSFRNRSCFSIKSKERINVLFRKFSEISQKVLTLFKIKGIVLNNHKQGDVKWLNRRHH